jgi:hypothetical protein
LNINLEIPPFAASPEVGPFASTGDQDPQCPNGALFVNCAGKFRLSPSYRMGAEWPSATLKGPLSRRTNMGRDANVVAPGRWRCFFHRDLRIGQSINVCAMLATDGILQLRRVNQPERGHGGGAKDDQITLGHLKNQKIKGNKGPREMERGKEVEKYVGGGVTLKKERKKDRQLIPLHTHKQGEDFPRGSSQHSAFDFFSFAPHAQLRIAVTSHDFTLLASFLL